MLALLTRLSHHEYISRCFVSGFLGHYDDATNTDVSDPNFDKRTTLAVWKVFIDHTKYLLERSGRSNITLDGTGIERFAKKHWKQDKQARWNGRQIRNAFSTAVAMAEFGTQSQNTNADNDNGKDVSIKVGEAEFVRVANAVKEFNLYMTETMGTTFEHKASQDGLRRQQKEQQKEQHENEKTKKKKKQSRPKRRSYTSSETESSESSENDDSDSD